MLGFVVFAWFSLLLVGVAIEFLGVMICGAYFVNSVALVSWCGLLLCASVLVVVVLICYATGFVGGCCCLLLQLCFVFVCLCFSGFVVWLVLCLVFGWLIWCFGSCLRCCFGDFRLRGLLIVDWFWVVWLSCCWVLIVR